MGVATALLFVVLGIAVTHGVTQSLDVRILRWVASLRTPLLDRLVLPVTALGSTAVLLVLLLSVSLFLWPLWGRRAVALLWTAVVGARILDAVLKVIFGRPRPTVVPREVAVTSLSFPSGHAFSSMVVYGVLALLGTRLMARPGARATTWVVAGLLMLLVGGSRVYLGVHYPSDILGGFLAGFTWLLVVVAAFRWPAPGAGPSSHGDVPPPGAAS